MAGGPAAKVTVRLDTRQAEREAAQFSSTLGKRLVSSGQSAAAVQAALNAAAGAATALGAAAVTAAVRSVDAWRGVETAIAEVQTIADASVLSVDRITSETQALARAHGRSTQAQIKGLYQAISSGVTDATQAFRLLDTANVLATGGLTDTATAIDGLTNVLNAFGLGADKAEDVADSLFTAVRFGKTRMEDLAGSVGQVSSIAAQSGLSFQEMNAALATITTRGVSTSEAVTQLRALLVAVSSQSEQAKKAAASLGLEFSMSALKAKGYAAFLRDLAEATNGSQEMLFKLLGRSEAVNAVLNQTSDGGETLRTTLRGMADDSGAAREAQERMTRTLDHQTKRLRVQLETMSERFGKAIKDSTALSTSVGGLTDSLVALEEWFSKSSDSSDAWLTDLDRHIIKVSKKLSAALQIIKRDYKDLLVDWMGFGAFRSGGSRNKSLVQGPIGAILGVIGGMSDTSNGAASGFNEAPLHVPPVAAELAAQRAAAEVDAITGPHISDELRKARRAAQRDAVAAEKAKQEAIAEAEKEALEKRKETRRRAHEEFKRDSANALEELSDLLNTSIGMDASNPYRSNDQDGALAELAALLRSDLSGGVSNPYTDTDWVGKTEDQYKRHLDVTRAYADQLLTLEMQIAQQTASSLEERIMLEHDARQRISSMDTESIRARVDTAQMEVQLLDMRSQALEMFGAALAQTLAATAQDIARGEFSFRKFIGSMITSLGQGLIQIGSAAVAAGTVGMLAGWLAPQTGGLAAIGAGAAAIGVGTGMLAIGGAIGGQASGGAAFSGASSRGFAGSRVGRSSFATDIPNRQPDALGSSGGGNVQNVYNFSFAGAMLGGSQRAITAGFKKMIQDENLTLANAGG